MPRISAPLCWGLEELCVIDRPSTLHRVVGEACELGDGWRGEGGRQYYPTSRNPDHLRLILYQATKMHLKQKQQHTPMY